ncbi:GNAT family N-acetyltransferase [Paenibacillus aurantius]|uniref:GNAT family N-acetyltransferase n=1 Tax=Paenibacillus aurantius TaxID=2918900 RepID=A0AA96LFT4_9BACL|nr:GNAT family N-acetyltransferase [Paenibacillus aurantius]WNQ12473.1 GNAT family N-acetyltransferase [Paenibacillus aurantius]
MNGIQPMRREDYERSIRLSEFAFQYEFTEEERAARMAKIKPEEHYGYYIDGTLAAKLMLMPMQVWLHGRKFDMGGIAGVATWPEYRRRGMVGQLLQHALEVMKEEGRTLSFLHPFSFGFYRRYGWETYVDYRKYELTAENLPRYPVQEGRVEATADWELLNGLYEAYASRYNGTLVRTEEWWQDRIFRFKKGRSVVCRNPSGEPEGYMIYQVKNKEMQIHEFVYLTEQARRSLWKFTSDHDSMAELFKMTAPGDDALPFLLEDPRIKQETVPYFMARIVDAALFLEQYPFTAGEGKREFVLHLEDLQAGWNRGSYRVAVDEEGRASVQRIESSPTDDHHREGTEAAPAGLACDIQTLAAVLIGYKRPGFLQRTGRLQGDDQAVNLLESLVPARQTYLLDFF